MPLSSAMHRIPFTVNKAIYFTFYLCTQFTVKQGFFRQCLEPLPSSQKRTNMKSRSCWFFWMKERTVPIQLMKRDPESLEWMLYVVFFKHSSKSSNMACRRTLRAVCRVQKPKKLWTIAISLWQKTAPHVLYEGQKMPYRITNYAKAGGEQPALRFRRFPAMAMSIFFWFSPKTATWHRFQVWRFLTFSLNATINTCWSKE